MPALQNISVLLRLESSQYSQGMARAIVATKQFDRSIKAAAASSTAVIGGISRTAEGLGLITGTAGAAAIKMAIDFESAFTGVLKTVEGTDAQLDNIRTGILDMSEVLPTTANEIAGVAEQAGQLGIETNNVLEFTKVMIDMGESTNLSASDAAQALARFFNIMGTGASKFDNLGSAIVDLGNNFATTESEITDISLRLAGAGKIVGLAESDILALSTAMSSIGIAAERGGTAMTRTLVEINTAVDGGGERLQRFADVAGTTATDFASTWRDQPIEAVLQFISGIEKLGEAGGNVSTTLDDLDLRGIRVQQTLTGLASAGDLTAGAVERSARAWEQNTALAAEAGRRYATTESQLRSFGNTLRRELIDTGTERLPELLALLEENADELPKILGDLADAGLNLFESLSKGIPLLEALAIIVSRIPPDLIAMGISVGFVSRFTRALIGPINTVLAGITRFPASTTAARLGLGTMSAAAHGATTSMRTAASSIAAADATLGASASGLAGVGRANAEIRRALNVPVAVGTGQAGNLARTANQTTRAATRMGAAAGLARVSFGGLTAAMVVGAIGLSEVSSGLGETSRQAREASGSIKEYSRALSAVLAEGDSPLKGTGPAFEFEGFPDQESTLDRNLNIFKEYGELVSAVGGDFQITSDVIDRAGLSMAQISREALSSTEGFRRLGQTVKEESGNLGDLSWLQNVFFWMDDERVDNFTGAWNELGREIRVGAIDALDELVQQGILTDGALVLMSRAVGEVIGEWTEFDETLNNLAPSFIRFVDAVSGGVSELGLDPRLGRTLSTLNIDLDTGQVNADGFLRSVSKFSDIDTSLFGLSDAGFEALERAVSTSSDVDRARRDAEELLRQAATTPGFTVLDFQAGLEAIGPRAGSAALEIARWNQEVSTARDLANAPPIGVSIDGEAVNQALLDQAAASEVADNAIQEAQASYAGLGYSALRVSDILTVMNDANEDAGRIAFSTYGEIEQQQIATALLGENMADAAQVANDLRIEEQDLVDITAALTEEFEGLAEGMLAAVPGMESAMGFMRERLQEQYDKMGEEFRAGTAFDEFVVDKTSLATYAEGLQDVQSGQAEAFQFATNIDFLGQDRRTDDLAKALARLAETDAEAAIKLAEEAVRIGPEAASRFETIIEEIEVANQIIQTVVSGAAEEVTSTDNRVRGAIQRGTDETVQAMVDKYGEGARAIIESLEDIEEAALPSGQDTLEGRAVQNVFGALDFNAADLADALQLTVNPDVDFDDLRTGEGARRVQALLQAAGFVDPQIRAVMELDDAEFGATVSKALLDVGALTEEQHLAVIKPILDTEDEAKINDLFTKVSQMTRDKKVSIDYDVTFRYSNRQDLPQAEQGRTRNYTEVAKTPTGQAAQLPYLQEIAPTQLKNLRDTYQLASFLPESVQRSLLAIRGLTDDEITQAISGDAGALERSLALATDELLRFQEEEGAEVPITADVLPLYADLTTVGLQAQEWAEENPIELQVRVRMSLKEKALAGLISVNEYLAKDPNQTGLVYAQGGIAEAPHVAQIAPAGSWRVWAEPETGGEAYIPLSANKRPRSESILSEVAKRFGYGLVSAADEEQRKRRHVRRFADGGLINAPMRPTSSVSTDNRTTVRNEYNVSKPVNFQGDMVMTDPRAAVEYAERQNRKNALIGLA